MEVDMKKYISFQLIVLMLVCNTLYVYAMEKESDHNTVCYLAMLPAEIWHYIAQFLPWEDQEQLIERMHAEKDEEFPEDHYAYFCDDMSSRRSNIYGVFSPDKHKIALCDLLFHICYEPDCDTCKPSRLIIVDLQQPEEEKVLYVGHFDKNCHRAIGLSSSGEMFVVIKKEDKKDVLMVNKIIEKSDIYKMSEDSRDLCLMKVVEQYSVSVIPEGFIVSRLMFNKQGSQVIGYGKDNRSEPIQQNYMLFNLKKCADEKAIVENKSEKNYLLDYFKHYRVCKELKGIEK
jgi:hypothetical protein